MNKGLEALERYRFLPTRIDYDTIEKELKRLEDLEYAYSSLEKAFDALSKEDEKTKKLLSKEIEKNRAFEIIKNKCSPLLKQYLLDLLPKEEYELLKEVLLWD